MNSKDKSVVSHLYNTSGKSLRNQSYDSNLKGNNIHNEIAKFRNELRNDYNSILNNPKKDYNSIKKEDLMILNESSLYNDDICLKKE